MGQMTIALLCTHVMEQSLMSLHLLAVYVLHVLDSVSLVHALLSLLSRHMGYVELAASLSIHSINCSVFLGSLIWSRLVLKLTTRYQS